MKPDVVQITFKNNPAVQEALQSAQPGQKIKLEGRYTVKAITPEGVDLIVEAYVPEGYEVDDTTDNMNMPGGQTMEQGEMTPAAMMVKKKQAKVKATPGPTSPEA